MSSDKLYRKLDEQNGEQDPLRWGESSAPPTCSAAHLDILETLAQAASDYKMASQNQEFAELNGGIKTMRRNLFTAVVHYERSVDDENERG